jgi:hypothetical protein
MNQYGTRLALLLYFFQTSTASACMICSLGMGERAKVGEALRR